MRPSQLLIIASFSAGANAFIPSASQGNSVPTVTTKLSFGLPSFGTGPKKDDEPSDVSEEDEKKIDLKGLVQLITAGMGSPFLGDYEGTDEETGTLMFSLEANNLVDEKGQPKQTQAPYFESGWVSEDDLEKEKKKKEGGSGGFKFW